jgi:hypothetical protein
MGWYLFRFQPFMIMPVASKRKTPASLEAVDATFSPTFFDESPILTKSAFMTLSKTVGER